MKKIVWFGLALIVFTVIVAEPSAAQNTITLYSPLKYNNDSSRASVDFQLASYAPRRSQGDVGYGFLRAGDEFDWLQSSGAQGSRSVILDLGMHAWMDEFTVPVVEPFAKLKPGEQRVVSVDASGADGEDGRPGAPGRNSADGENVSGATAGMDGADRPDTARLQTTPETPAVPRPPKHDGKVKVSSLWVKAIVGHIYVIHVVDDTRDFYALFRVEALQRGDNCTISWRLIAPPLPKS
jgi:hypothetical protein